jgi:ribosome recycling factor
MVVTYNFGTFKAALEGTLGWLQKEYSGIRTGRATPSILDTVQVNAYGSKMPINQVASVNVEGPKSLRISPWDKPLAKDIDVAIRESNLGVSVSIDDAGLRVSFPDLTSERRQMLIRLAKDKLEEARIRTRGEREKVLGDLERRQKAGEISEDEKFRLKNELQKLVEESNKKLEELFDRKEKEIEE